VLIDATPAPDPTNVQPVPTVRVGTPVLVVTNENSNDEFTFALLMSALITETAGNARLAGLAEVYTTRPPAKLANVSVAAAVYATGIAEVPRVTSVKLPLPT